MIYLQGSASTQPLHQTSIKIIVSHPQERGLGNKPGTYRPNADPYFLQLASGNQSIILLSLFPSAPSARMMDLSSIYFGLFLGIFPFTIVKVIQQSRKIVARSRTFRNAYLYMIWVEAVVNFVFAIITYLYLNGVVPGR